MIAEGHTCCRWTRWPGHPHSHCRSPASAQNLWVLPPPTYHFGVDVPWRSHFPAALRGRQGAQAPLCRPLGVDSRLADSGWGLVLPGLVQLGSGGAGGRTPQSLWGMWPEQGRTSRRGRLGPGQRSAAGLPGAFWEVLTQGPSPQLLTHAGTVGGGGAGPKGTEQPLWQRPRWAAETSHRAACRVVREQKWIRLPSWEGLARGWGWACPRP